jgi:hypothetical protein
MADDALGHASLAAIEEQQTLERLSMFFGYARNERDRRPHAPHWTGLPAF